MDTIPEQLARAREAWGATGEAAIATDVRYGDGEAVVIHVRKRPHRYDLDDGGRAVAKAGVRIPGWLEAAERAAAATGMNVNRSGVVFVGAVEGRDLASLAQRLAESAVAVHVALLELEER